MIEVEHVHKLYPARRPRDPDLHVLNDVSLTIPAGQFFTFIGPSGCGKSTLLRLIAGMEQTFSGSIRVNGQPVTGPDPKAIVVWQDFALMEWRTVLGNVEFGLEINGISAAERRERAEEYLRMVGLSGFARHYPPELSGGMKQRVAIARALVMNPDVLIMDEPFGALDAQTRMVMQDEILRIWEKWGKTVVFVTHSLDEALLLSDQIAVFTARPGRIKAVIPVSHPRPRRGTVRKEPSFSELHDYLYEMLREEVQAALRQEHSAIAGRSGE